MEQSNVCLRRSGRGRRHMPGRGRRLANLCRAFASLARDNCSYGEFVRQCGTPPCQRKAEMSALIPTVLVRCGVAEDVGYSRRWRAVVALGRRERSDRSPRAGATPSSSGDPRGLGLEGPSPGMIRRRLAGRSRPLLRRDLVHAPRDRLLVLHRHRPLERPEQPNRQFSVRARLDEPKGCLLRRSFHTVC